jgi:hypothetical protein
LVAHNKCKGDALQVKRLIKKAAAQMKEHTKMSISSKSKELLFAGNQTSGTKRTQRSWDEDSLGLSNVLNMLKAFPHISTDTHATWASSNSEDLAQPQIRRRLDSNTSNADGTTRSSSYQEHNQKTLTEVSGTFRSFRIPDISD